ncbi:MAG: hypothetical protein ACRBB0_25450 [Pelagimonas sp.]
MKDPKSAIFGTFYARRDLSGTIEVCGFVNARNSFAGMTGDEPYFVQILTSGRTGVPWLNDRKFVATQCIHDDLFGKKLAAELIR